MLYYNLGASLVRAQGPRAAWELAQQGTAFAQRHGIAEWVPLLEGTAVEAMADLSLIEQARTLMATALSHVAAEDWMGQVDLRCAEARIQARRGELSHSGLMDWIQQTVAKARELGEPQYLGGLLALAAIAWTAVGEARTAAPCLPNSNKYPTSGIRWTTCGASPTWYGLRSRRVSRISGRGSPMVSNRCISSISMRQ